MAVIDDLIERIGDPELRRRISEEVARMQRQKKFGLVFEEHLPEATPLYDVPIKKKSVVSLKDGYFKDFYLVKDIKGDKLTCEKQDDGREMVELNKKDVVAVAQFGEPIYPYLMPMDEVKNAPDSNLWHTLIEADNYHALQLLVYLYGGMVDCIYIDPPYNTGAKDWKYNNDYVDSSDAYRHSKWLSMMKKRLLLAKKLLNPQDSVLIVTIDEKEYLRLGCLLEELFPEARMQMVTIVHNPGGAIRVDALNRINEYAFYLFLGEAKPSKSTRAFINVGGDEEKQTDSNRSPIWRGLLRGGSNPLRKDSPLKFYPILVDIEGRVVEAGEPLPIDADRSSYVVPEGFIACWPIKQGNLEGRWELKRSTFLERLNQGYVRAGDKRKDGTRTIYYLRNAEIERLEKGELISLGKTEIGYQELRYNDEIERATFPKTVWNNPKHNATEYGSNLIKGIIGRGKFSYPKSLYAVEDSLSFIVANKPNALIVDFFAGSGTTLHAVNLLNAEDGGHRRCIMVTNNEVSEAEAKALRKQGYQPGDDEWEKYGIARYVNWPRTVCSIEGHDINGNPLKGNYLSNDQPMQDGFAANAKFFKLGFLDKYSVEAYRQFRELLPLLWMKAGAIGECPSLEGKGIPSFMILDENKMAIMTEESNYAVFLDQMKDRTDIKTVFLVVDSEIGFREMAAPFKWAKTYQLYKDYLENFSINYDKL